MWSPASILERWTRRPWRFLAVAALAMAALVALEVGLAAARAERTRPLGPARWIWNPSLDLEQAFPEADPVAFFAVAELELPKRPRRARLAIAVDEEYVVWLNGVWIGANRYRDGAAVDEYPVAQYLRQGINRVVIEARSLRSAGGILFRLEIGKPGSAEVKRVSDGTWRIVRQAGPEIHDPRRPLPEDALPALVWGKGDVGRWDLAPPTELRPNLGNRLIRALRVRELGARGRRGRWAGFANPDRQPDLRSGDLLFDWGRVRHGYLRLHLAGGSPPPSLVTFGTVPPTVEMPADRVVVAVPGSRRWDDTTMRRFRYVLVRGARLSAPPELRAVGPRKIDALLAPEPERRGVFGLEPPPATPLQEAVRERVDREAAASGR